MKILLTGNKGYIGTVLTEELLRKGYEVVGYDIGYYDGTDFGEVQPSRQIEKDIRNVGEKDLQGIDAVIHLAALSNDPLGELEPGVTEEINRDASIRLARLSKEAGVKRFIYASSQSMYGVSDTDEELDEDKSKKNPITAYARTKWEAEEGIKPMGDENFTVVFLRPSTVFGWSPKLRCDIVFNNLVACGYTTGKIEIKSDGTPWRPVVHVRDVANAFIAALEAPKELVQKEAFNVGIKNGNYTVRDLAEAAQRTVPGCKLVFMGEHADSRTYRVSFKKILTKLKDYYKPEWDLGKGGRELVEKFKEVGLTEDDFRGKTCNRLKEIRHLQGEGKISKTLRRKMRQAVILAGGKGTRTMPLTKDRPKPMIEIHGRPFLEYLIDLLKENDVEEVVLLLGYLPEKITEYFGDGSKHGIKIKYSIGDIEDDTGTRVRNAKDLLDGTFLLMYCDNYWPLRIDRLLEFHNERKPLMTTVVYTNKHGVTKNNIEIDENGYVRAYDRARRAVGLNGVELAFFVVDKGVLPLMPERNVSLEDEILPHLIEKRQIMGCVTDHRHFSIGKLERVPIMEHFLAPRKVVFLDRDGVINRNAPGKGYVTSWESFEFMPGAMEGMKLFAENGYEFYVITNQAGIARGKMTEQDLEEIHRKMKEELQKDGIEIKEIYYCPHDWNDGCECRKPKPGMFFQAVADHHVNLKNAIFIGDDERDKEAGVAAGVKSILFKEGETLLDVAKRIVKA